MKWRVLVSAPYLIPVIEEYRSRLESENVQITTVPVQERLSEAELLPLIETFDAVICGDDQFTERVLKNAGKLKVISKWGTGIDSIDTTAAAKLGIRVYNTPGAFTSAVADTALGYILCFARRLLWLDSDIRRGLWAKQNAVSLSECTLGIIGLGNIGKAVASRAQAFGMTIFGNDVAPVSQVFLEKTEVKFVPLAELLENSDFVSLHCDLNLSSFHLIGRSELELMSASAYLVNTARGQIIDETALTNALRERQIMGAALDVFEIEPLPLESPLRALDNCLFAPHNANSSFVARSLVHESTISNLLRGLTEQGANAFSRLIR